ncbi:MAG: alpha/beta hydrolase [Rickettsiales bacterium]|nr:alpha/beta hydrolase [Rickettsiales bacterium]
MLIEPEILSFDVPAPQGGTHRIACAQWGKAGDKSTVLCVHGLTRTGRDFDYIASALAADFHVLAPDMPGRGKSEWLSDTSGYSNPSYVADVGFVLKQLGISKLHWLGTSMGGIMGLMAANAAPGLIQSMIINDVGCYIPATGLERIRDISRMPTQFETRQDAEGAYRLRCAGFGITEEIYWKHLYAHGLERVGDSWRFSYDPAIFTAGFALGSAMKDMDLWPMWEALQGMPVLLLRGMDSDLLLENTAQEMKAKHPRLTLVEFEGVGHAPPLLADKQIAPIREWMSAIL